MQTGRHVVSSTPSGRRWRRAGATEPEPLNEKDAMTLAAEAREAAAASYSPYSGYPVGAALLARDGSVWRGCNVENASYGLTMCAERTALFKAVSEGRRDFAAIAIAGGTPDAPAVPCGACRQALAEFCTPETPVVVVPLSGGGPVVRTLGDYLPHAFGFPSK